MRNNHALKVVCCVTVCLMIFGLTAFQTQATPFRFLQCDSGADLITWNGATTTLSLGTISFPVGSIWDTEAQNSMASWNNVERSPFQFLVNRDTDGTVQLGNNVNEVSFNTIDGANGTLAVTTVLFNPEACGTQDDRLIESDVVFDVAEPWTNGTFAYTRDTTTNVHFQTVAVHEFGHVLGLSLTAGTDQHENGVMSRMNAFYPHSGPIGPSKLPGPIADDRTGLRFLYPQSGSNGVDLVASDFRRTGSGTSALVTGPTSASRGTNVTIQFTFMNIGTADSGSFNIGFFLSTNETISTSDRLLGTNFGSSSPAGGIGTFTRTLFIPTDVLPGTYFLGILLDSGNSVAELNEGNNGLAQPRTIRIN